ncbi:hypothetical protein HPB48_022313 [Haemaphysalis longicornis]|uniref:PHD-type domain-containing protein n=1 Tax=Haemaphysalis longicornis TaxID=44386 RepID=A0A9J6FW31_HAELO|nr:hypothetical protein HPB48_022313 [Haemaphysalis longicornis]
MLKCRICGNSYHLRCLRAVGLPKLPHGTLLDRHLWSCMKCVRAELWNRIERKQGRVNVNMSIPSKPKI